MSRFGILAYELLKGVALFAVDKKSDNLSFFSLKNRYQLRGRNVFDKKKARFLFRWLVFTFAFQPYSIFFFTFFLYSPFPISTAARNS